MNKTFFILSVVLTVSLFASCKQESVKSVDLADLQKSLNASSNVSKFRNAFSEHLLKLSALSPEELDVIHQKMMGCGLIPGKANIQELENCISALPVKDKFIEAEIALQESNKLEKMVENEFPELMQLDASKRAQLLITVNDHQAEEALNNQLIKSKK